MPNSLNLARSALVAVVKQRAWIVFPLAFLLNTFSMAAMLLLVGMFGCSEIAADIGLVQGATLALFYALSGNARNLILADADTDVASGLLQLRLLLVLPLAWGVYLLSVGVGAVAAPLGVVLIVRRVSEWVGEIGLSVHEQRGNAKVAVQTLMLDGISFVACLGLTFLFDFDLVLSAIPWALTPLWAVRESRLLKHLGQGQLAFKSLLPHLGSTAIIGCSVYVFRISIVLVAGKSFAGDMFTAYAIGGLMPTVFGQTLAPTLAHRYGASVLPRRLRAFFAVVLMIGSVVATTAVWAPDSFIWAGRSSLFWLAVGMSIAGGAVMVGATALRAHLIYRARDQGFFGADLLSNVLIANCVPFVYLILGPKALAGLYALSACLNRAFLISVAGEQTYFRRHRGKVLMGVGVLLVVPVFFQISGGLFRDPAFVFDSGSVISRLPIPLSVLGLFLGIALLGNYSAAMRTLTVLFFTCLLFVMSTILSSQGNVTNEAAKLLLLAQFLLPMFGLVLGEMYGANSIKQEFEWSSLLVLLCIVPLNLICTWWQGISILSPSLYLFSIYQHLQYLPMVVVALGLMLVFAFGERGGLPRVALWFLLPLLAIHVVASQSLVAMTALAVGLICFVYVSYRMSRSGGAAVILVCLALVAGFMYGQLSLSGSNAVIKKQVTNPVLHQLLSDKVKADPSTEDGAIPIPLGVSQRIDHWKFYVDGIFESPEIFVLGHVKPPDRAVHPSAHNYWLDVLYNFGLIVLLPLLVLTIWTSYDVWQKRDQIMSNGTLLGPAIAVAYLVLVENMLKVGMRQPYPGIITFFIWGLLIARLRSSSSFTAINYVQK